jgi:very-short-patch-repair endonuclease
LRHRIPIDGSHFRRQVPIGHYIADFCCLRAKLIIEVDGGQHGVAENAAYDARRTAYLGEQGFRVLRFTNAKVMTSIDSVLDTVYAALHADHPQPLTLPRKGEGSSP